MTLGKVPCFSLLNKGKEHLQQRGLLREGTWTSTPFRGEACIEHCLLPESSRRGGSGEPRRSLVSTGWNRTLSAGPGDATLLQNISCPWPGTGTWEKYSTFGLMTDCLELNIVQKQRAPPVGIQNWGRKNEVRLHCKMWRRRNSEHRRPAAHWTERSSTAR